MPDRTGRFARRVAGAYFLFAGAWIVVSDFALFELAENLPSFAGASLIKGGAFVLVTTALLYWFLSSQLETAVESAPSTREAGLQRPSRLNPAVVFGAMAVLTIAIVIAMFSYESGQHRNSARQQLRAILELKADQIEQLLGQRKATALSYNRSRGLRDDMSRLARHPDPKITEGIMNRIDALRRDLELDAVLMLDVAGKPVVASGPEELRKPSPELVAQAARSMASGTPLSHYLHRDAWLPGAPVLLDYITPLSSLSDNPEIVGAIVLRDNARNRLFRLIGDWPTPSASAESLLVRRDGDAVLFLNDIRHAKDTAFRLRRPLSDASLVAARAVITTGPLLTDGKDYRGTSVVAASRGIAGTDWILIAKIDADEVLAPVRTSALLWLGSILCMTLLAAAGIGILWRQQLRLVSANEIAQAAGRRHAEGRLSEAEERYRALFERSLDCVFLADFEGNFLDANHAALDLLGYRRDEISSIHLRAVLHPDDLQRALTSLENTIQSSSQRAPNEYRLMRKDGGEVAVEVRTSVVFDEGEPSAVLGIARDVTERKRAQRELEYRSIMLSTLQQTSPDAILLVGEDARIISCNRQFFDLWRIPEELASASEDEPVLQSVVSQMQDPGAFIAKVRYLYEHKEERSRDELQTKDGRIIDRYSAPVIGPNGEYFGRVWYFRDITERRRNEAALAQSEARFRQMAETIGEVFWMAPPDSTCIDYVSPGFKKIWGWTPAELYADPALWMKAIHPEDVPAVEAGLQRLAQGSDYDIEFRITRRDGALRWINDRGYALRDGAGRVILTTGVAIDITERKRSALELRESERRFSDMLGNVQMVSLMLDRNARITYCNDYLLRLTGWQRDEVVGRDWFEAFIPPDLDDVKVVFTDLIADEPRALHHENEILTRTGVRRLIRWNNTVLRSASGEVIGVSSIGEDITEGRQAEEALRESEQRFRTLVEQSISGFYLIQDNRFAYVNSRMAEIFGYASPDEIIGRSPSDLTAPNDRATVAENIRRRIAGEVADISYSFTGLRQDGSEIGIGVHGALASYRGRPAIIGLLQDISERNRAENEIKHYVARLEQAMQSTINVVATIGELRDPYTHGHERRVGEIAAALATEMGVGHNQVEGIRIAGYLHDVGKIGVPAEILSKPSRLTRAEYDLVKDHAQQSYEILKTVQFPWPVAEAAWQHHERMDGSGYPRGLKGDGIILEARVLAVADVVEAMSSHRPYRPGLGIDQALAEIEKNRGRLYCPKAVDACLRLFREKGYVLRA